MSPGTVQRSRMSLILGFPIYFCRSYCPWYKCYSYHFTVFISWQILVKLDTYICSHYKNSSVCIFLLLCISSQGHQEGPDNGSSTGTARCSPHGRDGSSVRQRCSHGTRHGDGHTDDLRPQHRHPTAKALAKHATENHIQLIIIKIFWMINTIVSCFVSMFYVIDRHFGCRNVHQ